MLYLVEFDYEEVVLMDEDGDIEIIEWDELPEYIEEGWIEGIDDIEQLL